ncbi:MAG: phosphoribosyl-AMP cyclohydrolase [Actinomycetota bacterium]|nr:phosphoribosyl-AMP cyclohydrolase [Actinomycetota bacterium]
MSAPAGRELAGAGAAAGLSATAAPLMVASEVLEAVRYDDAGLVVGIVQEQATNEVLMVAYLDAEALRRTIATGRTWFYSRSRQEYWCKGETSGNRQWVQQIRADCDRDALLITVTQEGDGACHTGERSCFFTPLAAPDPETLR